MTSANREQIDSEEIVANRGSRRVTQDDDYELRIRLCTTGHIPNTLRITVVFLRDAWLRNTIVILSQIFR